MCPVKVHPFQVYLIATAQWTPPLTPPTLHFSYVCPITYLIYNVSCPNHIFTNVPYSLALRLVRICSKREDLLKRFEELNKMLTSRGYNKNVIKSAIERASKIERKTALERVKKVKKDSYSGCWLDLLHQNPPF